MAPEKQCSGSSLAEMELHSSCNIDKISCIFGSFDAQKADLVTSIGFGHLLNLPFLGNLNLGLCLWLYQRVDVENKCLHLDGGSILHFTNHDVFRIFGIPSQGRPIDYSPNQSKHIVSALIDKLFRVSNTPSLTIGFLEHILTKKYETPMTLDEADVFKMAAVLYACTYLLAPESEPRFPLELVKNIIPPADPGQLNWADLVLTTIGRASVEAISQIKNGTRKICLFGCCIFVQVLYMDNLRSGHLSARHGIMPRTSTPSIAQLNEPMVSNSNGISQDVLMNLGNRQVTHAPEFCYSRRFRDHLSMENQHNDSRTCTHIISQAVQLLNTSPRQSIQSSTNTQVIVEASSDTTSYCYDNRQYNFRDGMAKLSRHATDFLTSHKLSLYHYSTPQDLPSGSLNPPGTQHHANFARKIVTSHSEFPRSPFDVNITHPDVHSSNKNRTYNWMTDPSLAWDVLQRDWIIFNAPSPLCIPGHVVQHCLRQNGIFTVSIVDAIMALWDFLDRVAYMYHQRHGHMHKRWRHFLPASFAETVLDSFTAIPNPGPNYYLNSQAVRSSFVGDHITYDLQNCQKIIVPVLDAGGTWSCYFWDLKLKRITVLDPTLMHLKRSAAMVKHCGTVWKLHAALLDCIDNFFSGWNIDPHGWRDEYITELLPRCRPKNSGLYAVHYARSFTGRQLAFSLKAPSETSLLDARGEIVYQMFACSDNVGFKPEDLMAQITIAPW